MHTISTDAVCPASGTVRRGALPRQLFVAARRLLGGPRWLLGALAREWWLHRAAAELTAMDDRLLRDMGLGRSEIDYLVRWGRADFDR